MVNEPSIDDLLAAVENLSLSKQKAKQTYDPSIGYFPTPLEKRLTQTSCKCGAVFQGLMTCVRGTENLYEDYQMPWCPFCVKSHMEDWFGHYLRMEEIEVVSV